MKIFKKTRPFDPEMTLIYLKSGSDFERRSLKFFHAEVGF